MHTHSRPAGALAPLLALALVACVRAAPTVAPGPIITDRPDFTESAVTVPHGHTQLEMGSTFTDEDGVRSVSTGEMLLRTGLSPRWELRLTPANHVTERAGASRAQGLEDAGLGVKIALHAGPGTPGSLDPTVALIVGTSLPTGAESYRNRRALPEVKFLTQWSLTERVAFASNLNWARGEVGGAAYDEWSGSGTFAFSLSERFGSYAEYYVFGDRTAAWQRRDYVNGGLTFLVNDRFQLDARVGARVDAPRDGVFFGLGFARLF
ncbi:MAG: transporter [Gemmatimonadetes bacterium]|nr:transporter [Gemmatimonadota bacterium]